MDHIIALKIWDSVSNYFIKFDIFKQADTHSWQWFHWKSLFRFLGEWRAGGTVGPALPVLPSGDRGPERVNLQALRLVYTPPAHLQGRLFFLVHLPSLHPPPIIPHPSLNLVFGLKGCLWCPWVSVKIQARIQEHSYGRPRETEMQLRFRVKRTTRKQCS